jgi:hypothetical protein
MLWNWKSYAGSGPMPNFFPEPHIVDAKTAGYGTGKFDSYKTDFG